MISFIAGRGSMKNKILNKCMNIIQKNNTYDEVKLAEIKYGLEGIYLLISKLIVIGILAYCLHLFKELFVFLFLYNIIRMPSFGLHATKGWICLVSSTIIFIGVPWLCKYMIIPTIVKVILGIILILLFYKNAPADTYKRPIINPKRRMIYKTTSIIIALIFVECSILITNQFISNCCLMALIVQSCMISPFVYKIFGLPYDNYKVYLSKNAI